MLSTTTLSSIKRQTKHFGVDAELIESVCLAEGNILKAVQCSIPTTANEDQAIEITGRSCVHAMSDFIKSGGGTSKQFIDFWASRWAPQGAKNDPTNLNKNWARNVLSLWYNT